jgi:histidyl-tRNA synthetase
MAQITTTQKNTGFEESSNDLSPAIRERFHEQGTQIQTIVLQMGEIKKDIGVLNHAREMHSLEMVVMKTKHDHTINLIQKLETSFDSLGIKMGESFEKISRELKSLYIDHYIIKGTLARPLAYIVGTVLSGIMVDYLYKLIFGN